MRHQPFSIAIHGGINAVWKLEQNKQHKQMILNALEMAARAGHQVLIKGGNATEAVAQAVKIFEDYPHFNAGKGAVLTFNEMIELEAAIIDGKQGDSGAVACVRHVKNPILLALDVMKHKPNELLVGEGAERFACYQGHQYIEQDYFFTDHRYEQLMSIKESRPLEVAYFDGYNLGNVGAIALDQHGSLAAATSGGGGANKLCGQVSDTVIIGRSIAAENGIAAVSFVGGDVGFFGQGMAGEVIARMKYLSEDLQAACTRVIDENLLLDEDKVGLTAIDDQGNVHFCNKSLAMFRAAINVQGELSLAVEAAR